MNSITQKALKLTGKEIAKRLALLAAQVGIMSAAQEMGGKLGRKLVGKKEPEELMDKQMEHMSAGAVAQHPTITNINIDSNNVYGDVSQPQADTSGSNEGHAMPMFFSVPASQEAPHGESEGQQDESLQDVVPQHRRTPEEDRPVQGLRKPTGGE